MVLLCIDVLYQYFSVTVNVFHKTHQVRCYHSFIVEIVVESVNLTQNVKIENYNHHDGEQLLFLKNFKNNKKKSTYQNTERKEGCS